MFDWLRVGHTGERLAERHLRGLGYKVLARNYRCPVGEIDLIVLDERTIAFVEVKTRRGDEQADPEDTVTHAKQRQLSRVARYWLSQRQAVDRTCRFDVVAVVLPENGEPVVRHTPNAFPVISSRSR